MPNNFTMTKNYQDAQLLLADDLDQMAFSLENFLNFSSGGTGVNNDNIQDSGLIGSNLAPGSVVTASIAANSISTDKLATGAVTSIKIANNAITNSKIPDNEITRQKLANPNQDFGSFATTVSGSGLVELASVTLTTVGRPVYIFLPAFPFSGTPGTNDNSFQQGVNPHPNSLSTNLDFEIFVYRDLTLIYESTIKLIGRQSVGGTTIERRIRIPTGCVQTMDDPSAGAHTYKLYMQLNNTAIDGSVRAKMEAIEL